MTHTITLVNCFVCNRLLKAGLDDYKVTALSGGVVSVCKTCDALHTHVTYESITTGYNLLV